MTGDGRNSPSDATPQRAKNWNDYWCLLPAPPGKGEEIHSEYIEISTRTGGKTDAKSAGRQNILLAGIP